MEESNQDVDFVELITALIPEDMTIEDMYGNKHRLPSRLSARRQVRALRLLEKGFALLNTIDIDQDSFSDVESMIKAATGLLGNDEVIDLMDEIFIACYPKVAEQLDGQPSDMFDIEDLVKAFGPLALAFAKTMTKAGSLIQAL